MNVTLITLISVGVLAVAIAAYAILADRERRRVVDRASGMAGITTARLPVTSARAPSSVGAWLLDHAPQGWSSSAGQLKDKLTQAGYDGPSAPLMFATFRLGLLLLLPLIVATLGPQRTFQQLLLYTGGAIVVAWLLPVGWLDRQVRLRQTRIRRALPDALDLLVVCVEAGTSLDAAILRVARESQLTAPDLARELMIVNRKTNAGVVREEALRGLANRTGVAELRALVSSMIQSEKWGTSIANVLRVNAEALRRQRRQLAEQEAQKAPLKMIFPLVAMILPALFIIIMGPAVMKVMKIFAAVSH
jgi:tight adherence protein C